MADMSSAVRLLEDEFPGADVGVDNHRPYARTTDGTLYGVLFGTPHAGDQLWERGPIAIVQFTGGQLSARQWEVKRWLV